MKHRLFALPLVVLLAISAPLHALDARLVSRALVGVSAALFGLLGSVYHTTGSVPGTRVSLPCVPRAVASTVSASAPVVSQPSALPAQPASSISHSSDFFSWRSLLVGVCATATVVVGGLLWKLWPKKIKQSPVALPPKDAGTTIASTAAADVVPPAQPRKNMLKLPPHKASQMFKDIVSEVEKDQSGRSAQVSASAEEDEPIDWNPYDTDFDHLETSLKNYLHDVGSECFNDLFLQQDTLQGLNPKNEKIKQNFLENFSLICKRLTQNIPTTEASNQKDAETPTAQVDDVGPAQHGNNMPILPSLQASTQQQITLQQAHRQRPKSSEQVRAYSGLRRVIENALHQNHPDHPEALDLYAPLYVPSYHENEKFCGLRWRHKELTNCLQELNDYRKRRTKKMVR